MRAQLVFTTALLLGAAGAGCTDILSDISVFPDGTGGASGTTGTAGTGGTGGTMTTTTTTVIEPQPECIPSTNAMPVVDECGVFVSASKGDDATGDGSKAKPVATPSKALELSAGEKPVYLCAEAFAGPIELDRSVFIYGGLDCANGWEYVGGTTPTEISAAPDTIPLRVTQGISIELQDCKIVAADATIEGGSSIAVLVETDANLSLVRTVVEAGVAFKGVAGAPYGAGAADGQKGSNGAEACSAGTVLTPEPPTTECGDPDSAGGSGGVSTSSSGGSGNAGEPFILNNGGAGDPSGQCGPGTKGNDGEPGVLGPGAPAGIGTLDPQKGFVGASGSDGAAGKPGQGGGGGGASRGGTGAGKCSDPANAGGASGGSGGSGGCGGLGGKGGGPGGSSIAIVSFGKELRFDSVKIVTKTGGAGGDGGPGQLGGLPVSGGAGGTVPVAASLLKAGCTGGPGGAGGQGGQGGGGLGGHSIGIAHNGSSIDGMPEITVGTPVEGGLGDGAPGKGASGVAQQVQEF